MTLVHNELELGSLATAVVVPNMPTTAGNMPGADGYAGDFLPSMAGAAVVEYAGSGIGPPGRTRLHVAADATNQNAYIRWNSSAASPTGMFQTTSGTIYGYCDVMFPSLPSASVTVMALTNASSQIMVTVRVLSTGFVSVRDSTNTAGASATTSTTNGKVVAGQWARIKWKAVLSSTTGQTEVKVYPNVASTTNEVVTSAATLNTNGAASYGHVVGLINASTSASYYIYRVGFNDVGYLVHTQRSLERRIGGVSSSSVTVKAKVTPSGSTARLVVDTVNTFNLNPRYSSSATADADGVVTTTVTNLEADTAYYYAIELNNLLLDGSTISGELVQNTVTAFRTSPAGQQSFSFAAISNAKTFSDDAVFDTVRTKTGSVAAGSRTAAFVAHLGNAHARAITANDGTLFQRAWDEVMANPKQRSLLSAVPTAYAMGDLDSGGGANHDGTAAAMAAAQTAYRSRVPAPTLPAADGLGTYYSFVVGRVRFIVTDRYSYKSPIAATDNSSKTMLGAAQKAWLKTQLSSGEPLKVWLDGHWHGGTTFSGDGSWSAYSTERTEISQYVATNGVRLLIVGAGPLLLAADSGANSPGGIPFFGVSPLDAATAAPNATYSAGNYPTSYGSTAHLFGWFDVVDSGSQMEVTYTGYDSAGASHVSLVRTYDLGGTGQALVWSGSAWAQCPVKVYNGSAWVQVSVRFWDGTSWVDV